jgi:hypothetical protein
MVGWALATMDAEDMLDCWQDDVTDDVPEALVMADTSSSKLDGPAARRRRVAAAAAAADSGGREEMVEETALVPALGLRSKCCLPG